VGKLSAGSGLTLCIGVNPVGLDHGRVLKKPFDDVDSFPNTRRNEVAEERNVTVADMVIVQPGRVTAASER
jgi:hypothetical protein